jgi:hypothetical protein
MHLWLCFQKEPPVLRTIFLICAKGFAAVFGDGSKPGRGYFLSAGYRIDFRGYRGDFKTISGFDKTITFEYGSFSERKSFDDQTGLV